MSSQLDRLDCIAARLFQSSRAGAEPNDKRDFWGVLSTGEKLYVALAANRGDLLTAMDYTIAEALVRIGDEWVQELTRRWQYGVPEAAAIALNGGER